jgi:hypothetical protein
MSRLGLPFGNRLTEVSMYSQSGPPMMTREPKRSCMILAPPTWSPWAWLMITVLTWAGSRPTFLRPSMIASSMV